MPDDIPLFPNETNLEKFRDFVNLQKEMNDHLLTERRLYEQIGRINLDIESRVVQRRQNEFNMMKDTRDLMVKLNQLAQQRATLAGTAREALEKTIQATKEEIDYKRELIEMSRLASDIEVEMTKKAHDENTRWFKFASSQMKNITGFKSDELALTKSIGEEMIKNGHRGEFSAFAIGAVLMMLKGALDLFKKMDKAAWEFRKAMGMTRPEAAAIRKSAEQMAIDFMHVGVTIEGAYKSFQALGKAVGGIHNVSKDLAVQVALMSSQLGIAEETSVGFLRNLAAISKNTMESQQSLMGFAQAMASAGGVPLGDVMKDVSSRSSTTLTMMSRLPNVALKSAIELRRMGTSLDQAAKSSRHILDFTENVNEEMDASVLLGRSINLQRARELAYRRDLEGSTKEILRLTKSINFEKLDVFQQEAYARATGKSVDELLNMLQTNRQIESVRRSGTVEQQRQLKAYEQMHAANAANAKAIGQSVDNLLRQSANQERIVAIQAKWNQLLAKAQQFLLPVIDRLLEGALVLTQWAPQMMAFTTDIGEVFTAISKVEVIANRIAMAIYQWNTMGFKSLTFFQKILGVFGKIPIFGKAFTGVLVTISKTFGFLGKFLGVFGKFLGPIGWIIMAFQGITGFIKGWNAETGAWYKKLGSGVMGALRAIIPGFDWIMKGVKWVWQKVKDVAMFWYKWLSPIAMIKGEVKLLAFVFDKIKEKIMSVFGIFKKIGGVISNLFHKDVEHKVKASYVPAVTVTPQGTKLETGGLNTNNPSMTPQKEEPPGISEETGQKMVDLLSKILAKDTNVHMDGQLLSTSLARQTEFRGGYGVNKVS